LIESVWVVSSNFKLIFEQVRRTDNLSKIEYLLRNEMGAETEYLEEHFFQLNEQSYTLRMSSSLKKIELTSQHKFNSCSKEGKTNQILSKRF
jgi:hypothetical protein